MKKILIIAVSSVLFVSCSGNSNVKEEQAKSSSSSVNTTSTTKANTISIKDIQNSNKGASYDSVLKLAKAEQKKAQKVNGEWNTIRKLMKKAKKDYKGGNDSAAIKKLNKAIIHARLGVKQAADQTNAGPRF